MDILNEKEHWLAILEDKGSVKKFRSLKRSQLKRVLSLWVNNALNTKQDIDDNILKTKAAFFARRFSIRDFYQSEGWLDSFKRWHELHQFKKQGETSSAPPAESIENNRFVLQQLLRFYNPKNI